MGGLVLKAGGALRGWMHSEEWDMRMDGCTRYENRGEKDIVVLLEGY